MNKCEICGKDAPFFTETYDPGEKKGRTIYLCEEHQLTMYRSIVNAILDMDPSHITESEENPVGLKMKYGYTHHNAGGTKCLDCEFMFCGEDRVCHCDLLGCRVYKGDICKGFKRRGWHINEGTPDERILERIKEAMDDKPMPIIPAPILTPTGECLKEIGEVLSWMYCRGIHMFGTDEEIEAAIRRIGGEEE